jgi:hypothetical protein
LAGAVKAFIDEDEARRQLAELRAMPVPEMPEKKKIEKTGTRFFKIPDGKYKGTVSIDKHGTFAFRPFKRHSQITASLEGVVGLVVIHNAKAEAAKDKKPRKFMAKRGKV